MILSVSVKAGELPKPSVKTVMISGKIQDAKSNELLAGVKIECENCQKVVYSDLSGRFFIYLQVNTQQDFKIEFSQVGYSSKTIDSKALSVSAGNLEINLDAE